MCVWGSMLECAARLGVSVEAPNCVCECVCVSKSNLLRGVKRVSELSILSDRQVRRREGGREDKKMRGAKMGRGTVRSHKGGVIDGQVKGGMDGWRYLGGKEDETKSDNELTSLFT